MPELSTKSVSLEEIPVIEGIVLPNLHEVFEYIRITNDQLLGFAEMTTNLVKSYGNIATQLQGTMQEFAKSQQRIAQVMVNLSKQLALVGQIDLIIRAVRISELPRVFLPIPETQLRPVQIFVQPTRPYVPQKALPNPKRKQKLQLTAVNIEENGFVINGEYIRGMTRKSKTGKLLELLIRKDLAGVISDDLIYKTVGIEINDYRARDFVFRDLKDILMGNKLDLSVERYRGIKQYKATSITKRIRKPRKTKQTVKTTKSN